MSAFAAFFEHNIVVIYFFYGLAFFSMGLGVWLESGRASDFRLARTMGPLAGFGILHGLHEWFEMFQWLARNSTASIPDWLLRDEIRIPHLVLSFVLLIIFGTRLIYASRNGEGNERAFAYLSAGLLVTAWLGAVFTTRWLYAPDQAQLVTAVDVLARYMLGIPGALLAAWAILLEQRTFKERGMGDFGRALLWAALTLCLYGLIGQAFPPRSILFPSTLLNSELFLRQFGFPVQLFRAIIATVMAVLVIRALRAFELDRQRQLMAANEARLAAKSEALAIQRQAQIETEQLNRDLQAAILELQAREELRCQLLHQVVSAQEGERQRIARELHDGTGQILTGLGLGLVATGEAIHNDPERAVRQLNELKLLSGQAMQELRDVIADLRPSVLDDLGLVAALQGQVKEFETRTGVTADLKTNGRRRRVQAEIETIVFRIAQEGLTNVARHGQATNVTVDLTFSDEALQLIVCDDGRGFDPQAALRPQVGQRPAWGLLGMQERASLVGGHFEINSQRGRGTTIQATIPLLGEKVPL